MSEQINEKKTSFWSGGFIPVFLKITVMMTTATDEFLIMDDNGIWRKLGWYWPVSWAGLSCQQAGDHLVRWENGRRGSWEVESEGSPGKASERREWAVEPYSQILLWEKSGAGQLNAVKVLAAYTEYTGCQSQKLIGKYYSPYSFRLVCSKHCQKQNLSIFYVYFQNHWFTDDFVQITQWLFLENYRIR